MQQTIEERHITPKNLVDILNEGWIVGLGEIAENPHLVDEKANEVYPQDLIDTVRIILEKCLMQEGVSFLMKSQASSVTYRIERPYQPNAGRFVPNLDLELIKSNIKRDDTSQIFGRLNYRKNPDYFTFAQFDVPQKFIDRLIKK
jgi:hypothetical protein